MFQDGALQPSVGRARILRSHHLGLGVHLERAMVAMIGQRHAVRS